MPLGPFCPSRYWGKVSPKPASHPLPQEKAPGAGPWEACGALPSPGGSWLNLKRPQRRLRWGRFLRVRDRAEGGLFSSCPGTISGAPTGPVKERRRRSLSSVGFFRFFAAGTGDRVQGQAGAVTGWGRLPAALGLYTPFTLGSPANCLSVTRLPQWPQQ